MQLYAQSMHCHLLGVASLFLTFSNFILKTVYSKSCLFFQSCLELFVYSLSRPSFVYFSLISSMY